MGGEKGEYDTDSDNDTGSPPHGRGKGVVNGRAGLLVGITPAWAGKRRKIFYRKYVYRDHPRVGGEKPAQQGVEPPCMGSPPHGRGKARGLLFSSHCARITPA